MVVGKMLWDLKDRCCIVTGAAGKELDLQNGIGKNIGEAIARILANQGVKLIGLVDLEPNVKILADDINRWLDKRVALPFLGSVTDALFMQSVYDSLSKESGQEVTVLVPCAGILKDSLIITPNKEKGIPILCYPTEKIREVLEVNAIAVYAWTTEMAKRIATQRLKNKMEKWNPNEGIQAKAVLIGSISKDGNKGQISYAMSKASLVAMKETMNLEWIDYGIRIDILHPGFTSTPMLSSMPQKLLDKFPTLIPIQRFLVPQEIAHAVKFLLENDGCSELTVSGGTVLGEHGKL
jgi:3-oxoacyl-[acyl-carrier protein] reductase